MIDTLLTTRKKPSLKHLFGSIAIYLYLIFVGLTKRIIAKFPKKYLELKEQNKPCIYALWHNQQAFIVYLTSRFEKKRRICSLVSLSSDGEYIARAMHKFGIKAMRGSTSKGGFFALRRLIDIAQAGYSLAITPDGPRGPIYTIQPGIIFLAQKTGLPIVPVACKMTNKLITGSWDKLEAPLPFGKCAYLYGDPIYLSRSDDPQKAKETLRLALNKLTEQAENLIS